MSVGLTQFLGLSALLFSIGIFGLLTRRNAVGLLMATELILNSVNLNLVAFNRFVHPGAMNGQIFTLFTITVAAGEATVALALVVSLFRAKRSVMVEDINAMKW
ncbi:MAG: NADH-quinone oxidoreductase subunit NuoK [candidate division FCPU426 bacterium]